MSDRMPSAAASAPERSWRLDDGATVVVRNARSGAFVDAYPAGTNDREVLTTGFVPAGALRTIVAGVLADEPDCRRVVLALPEGDVNAIAWAEDAGFRYVVDVEVRSGAFSLLVTEPDWVLAQPHILEDIPLKE